VERPGYEGMGLGLFIAKTLLERTGAQLGFFNGAEADPVGALGGAVVTVAWPRSAIEAWDRDGLGANPQLRP
jgi:two-component system, sensor histidine kinase RegB